MFWFIAAAALTTTAAADSFTLENGSTIEGTLATYELGGNCQIFVAKGQVRGATLLLPCDQIVSYQRDPTTAEAHAPPALAVEELGPPAPIPNRTDQGLPSTVDTAARATDPVPGDPPAVAIIELPEAPPPGDSAGRPDATPTLAIIDLGAPTSTTAPATLTDLPANVRFADANLRRTAATGASTRAAVTDGATGEQADPAVERADPAVERADPAVERADPAVEQADPAARPVPEGWTRRSRKPSSLPERMPRWLYKAVYGVEPPDEADTSNTSDDSDPDVEDSDAGGPDS